MYVPYYFITTCNSHIVHVTRSRPLKPVPIESNSYKATRSTCRSVKPVSIEGNIIYFFIIVVINTGTCNSHVTSSKSVSIYKSNSPATRYRPLEPASSKN